MDSGRTRFAGAVTFAFLVLGSLGIARHEIWRDEMHTWLVVLDSRSLPEMLHNMRYDAHPALWYSALWIVSRWTRSPLAMQVLHLALTAAAVFLFARNAPFSRTTRALFAFGYFPLFEYGLISRNYGIGLLLVAAFCSLAGTRARSYLPLAVTLALLANASALAWVLAAVFAGALAFEAASRPEVRRRLAGRAGEVALAVLLYAAGAVLGALQMRPPADSWFGHSRLLSWSSDKLLLTLSTVSQAYLPLPDFAGELTWSSALLWRLPAPARALLGVVLLAAFAARLARTRTWLALYVAGSLALLAFTYLIYFGWLRHHGHLFVLLVACLWLARRDEGAEQAEQGETGDEGRREPLLVLLLAVHLLAGVTLYALDLALPFSTAKETAALLERPDLAGMPVVASPDFLGIAVSGYLGRPVHHLETGRPGTYVALTRQRSRPLSPQEICEGLGRVAAGDPRGALLVAGYVPSDCRPGLELSLVAAFPRALVSDERLLVFLARRPPVR